MGMPRNLILVRHGESEGNAVQQKYKQLAHSALFTPEFLERHESEYRLTEKGVQQAQSAGLWLRDTGNVFNGFDRLYVSGHIRAMETAANLGLPGEWFVDLRLRERDGGLFNTISPDQRDLHYRDWQKHAKSQPFLWRPPQGESIADVSMRVKDILETICRECDGKNVIIVCHGHVIRCFRIWLERIFNYNEMCTQDGAYSVLNCSIWQYVRFHPEQQLIDNLKYASWMRVIDPTNAGEEMSKGANQWVEIKRPRFSNEELLEHVSKVERLNFAL